MKNDEGMRRVIIDDIHGKTVKEAFSANDTDPRLVISFNEDNSLLVYSKAKGLTYYPPHDEAPLYEYRVTYRTPSGEVKSDVVIEGLDDDHAFEEAGYMIIEPDWQSDGEVIKVERI